MYIYIYTFFFSSCSYLFMKASGFLFSPRENLLRARHDMSVINCS